jgi:hypothetical protein
MVIICFDVYVRLRNTMDVCIQDEWPPTSIFRMGNHAKAKLRFSEREPVLVGLNQIRMSEVTSADETYVTCTLCGRSCKVLLTL